MKVILIYPEFTDIYGRYRSAAKVGVVYPPLGLMYLASSLEQGGHDVKIIDTEVDGLSKQEIVKIVVREKPDVVGITSTTPIHHKAIELFKVIKEADSSIMTLSGGPHPTSLPEDTLKECAEIDIVIIGEAEETIREVCDSKKLSDIKGICYRKNGKIKFSGERELIKDLDKIPLPARHLVKNKKYLWSVPKKGIIPITPVMTTRGCPYKCIFCSQLVIFGNCMRYRSVDNVVKEIDEIVNKYKINHLVFYDDTLGLNRKLTYELVDAIKKSGLEFTFEGMTRVNIIDRELLQKLKSIGLNRLSFGVESGNQHILDASKKGITLEQIKKAYELTSELGIETRMSIVLGLPFETKKSIEKTIKFMKSLECYQAYVNIGTPFPGTEYYDMAVKGYGGIKLLTKDWKEFRRWGNAVIEVNDLKRDDLIKYQKKALMNFYMTPRRVVYNLRRAGIKAAVINSVSAAKSLLLNKK
ncbi:B12-binding domain-containing radical SAM protein [Candidatus Woesearchaeota archaeon]|nr:B12-binding domain-containing radical SAM protein [Candidatus Woesearchaeota archaeon]